MSLGGTFTLVSNQGLQDRLIYNIDRLRGRVKEIHRDRLICLKKNALNQGKTDKEILQQDQDWAPTINSISNTHVVYVNSSFKPHVPITHEYSKTEASGNISLGNTFNFTLPQIGEFINDCAVYVKLTGLSAVNALDKVKYVEYLAHRLFKSVKFKVQNHVFDEYGTDEYNAHWNFHVSTDKSEGYLKNIGQEIPKIGFLTADPTVDEVREYRYFGDGSQTFKRTQTDVELWVPLLFWFKDIQTALPNFILPFQQTQIEITFEGESNLVAFANYGGGGAFNVPEVNKCHLYANHLFLLPDIASIYVKRFGVQLIRVHKKQVRVLTSSQGSVHLNEIKFPIEHLIVGFRPQVNLTNSQRWHRNTSISDVSVKEAVVTGVATIQVNNAVYLNEIDVVADLGLKVHGITIYPTLTPGFYNGYTPYRYGQRIKTPNKGWFLMNFNLNPGAYQPSGHINISTSRELYLDYTSALDSSDQYIISPTNPVDMIVLARAINFLMFKGGNVVLKFST